MHQGISKGWRKKEIFVENTKGHADITRAKSTQLWLKIDILRIKKRFFFKKAINIYLQGYFKATVLTLYLHSNGKQIKIVLFNILNHQSSNHEIMVKTEIAVYNWL